MGAEWVASGSGLGGWVLSALLAWSRLYRYKTKKMLDGRARATTKGAAAKLQHLRHTRAYDAPNPRRLD